MFLAVMAAGIAGAVLFSHYQPGVFWASAAASTLALACVARLPGDPSGWAALGGPVGGLAPAAPPDVRWWCGYYVLLRAVTLAAFVGFLPYYFFTQLNVDLAYFGAVLSLFSLGASLAARYAARTADRFGPVNLVAMSLLCSVSALGTIASSTSLGAGLIGITLLGLSSGGVRPLTMSAIGRAGMERLVATRVTSRLETAYGVVNAVVLLGGTLILSHSGFSTLMLALAAGVATAGIGLLLHRPVNLAPADTGTVPSPATAPG